VLDALLFPESNNLSNARTHGRQAGAQSQRTAKEKMQRQQKSEWRWSQFGEQKVDGLGRLTK
jgi:hypothetical protein